MRLTEILTEAQWGKGGAVSGPGLVCLSTAIKRACYASHLGADARCAVFGVIRDVIREKFPGRVYVVRPEAVVPDFNDAPETTWGDVAFVLGEAERRLDVLSAERG